MIMKIFSVFDSKAEAYMMPFFQQSRGQAIRMFTDTVNDKESLLNKHAADFTLFEIADFDDSNAAITPYPNNHNLGCAIEFLMPIPEATALQGKASK